jgi:two-component system chemotaxis response regulator CheB
MPANAQRSVAIDHCVSIEHLAPLLVRLAHEPIRDNKEEEPVSEVLAFEAAAANWDVDAVRGVDRPGEPSPFGCPDCGGDLWEIAEGKQFHFRCRTGHAYAPLNLLAGQSGAVEESLNEAFRALLEKAHLEKRLMKRSREIGAMNKLAYHESQARKAESNALVLREMLRQLREITGDEIPAG